MSRQQRRANERRQRKSSDRARRLAGASGAALTLSAYLIASADPALAATIQVTTTADSASGAGSVQDQDASGFVTLREAVEFANASAGADVITFAPGLTGSITLSNGQLLVTDGLTVSGPGRDVLSVSGSDTSRLFSIDTSASTQPGVTLSGLTLTNGRSVGGAGSEGGAVRAVGGTLTLNGVRIKDSIASIAGGGLFFQAAAELHIADSIVSNNTARNSADDQQVRGGGIRIGSAAGPVTLARTIVSGNSVDADFQGYGGFGNGGGLSATLPGSSSISITNDTTTPSASSVTGNSVIVDSTRRNQGPGGGLWIQGDGAVNVGGTVDATVQGTVISGNVSDGNGGGLYATDLRAFSLTGSTLADNDADGLLAYGGLAGSTGSGGGGYLSRLTGTLTSDVVRQNEAGGTGGGLSLGNVAGSLSFLEISGNRSTAGGGGIAVSGNFGNGKRLSIGNSTISGNTSSTGDGGGITLLDTTTDVVNSTVSGNTSSLGEGGGLYLDGRTSQNNPEVPPGSIRETTVVSNLSEQTGPGMYITHTGPVGITNGIIANNDRLDAVAAPDVAIGVTDDATYQLNYTLVERPGLAVDQTAGTGNRFNVDPALGDLFNNGGTLRTHLPTDSSPVVDAGDPGYEGQAFDQRGTGFPRVVARLSSTARIDMGAVEVPAAPPPPPPAASPSPSPSPTPTSVRGRFRALATPLRVLDSRTGTGTSTGPKTGQVLLDLSGAVPAGTTSVVLNVTVANGDHDGYVVGYPSGTQQPRTSNLNFTPAETQANEVVVALSSDRKLVLEVVGAHTSLIADLVGFFNNTGVAGSTSNGGEVRSQTPTRLLDTRTTGQVLRHGAITLDLTSQIPAGSTAAVLNVTITRPQGPGFAVVYAGGTAKPGTSNVNFVRGRQQANEAFTRLGTGPDANKVTVYIDGADAALVVDLVATVGPEGTDAAPGGTGAGDFTALRDPVRAMDTRNGTGGVTGRINGTRTLTLPAGAVPAGATAALLNVTAVGSDRVGWVAVYPGGAPQPPTSSVNFAPGQVQANAVITGLGAGRTVTLTVGGIFSPQTHVVVDIVGFLLD